MKSLRMPQVMALRIFMVSVVSAGSRNCKAHVDTPGPEYRLASAFERQGKSSSEYRKGYVRAYSSSGYSGMEVSKCSSVTVLSKRSSDVVPSNVATATELSNGSCSQRN